MSSLKLNERIASELSVRKSNDSLRSLSMSSGKVDFCSNDYLGLRNNVVLSDDLPQGSGGSRLISGNYPLLEQFERDLAIHGNMPASLVFNSGYSANLGLISCVAKRGDVILYDKLVHASIRDGLRLTNAQSYSVDHNDFDHLESMLHKFKGQTTFFVLESVYSMDGDNPDFNRLKTLKENYDFNIILDEAHSFGLYGHQGAGLSVLLGLDGLLFAKVVTFGKAMGSEGAAVLGSEQLRSYLINFSRPFIYTTAPSPSKVAGMISQWKLMCEIESRNAHSIQLKSYFIEKIKNKKICISGKYGNIIGVLVKGNSEVRNVAVKLQNNGLDVRPILSPTVKEGEERLRICFHEFNTLEEVSTLADSINSLLAQ